MILSTARLILRNFSESDLPALADILANPLVMQFSLAGPLTRRQTEEMLKNRILNHYEEHGFGLYAVIDKDQHDLLGFVGISTQVKKKE